MRTHSLLITCAILSLVSFKTEAQQVFKCDSTHAYWAFDKDSSFFSVKLNGKLRKSQNPKVIGVDSFILQYVIVYKSKFVESPADTGLMPLIKYAQSEGEYMSGSFHSHLDLHMEKVELPDHKVLLWYFEMPAVAGPDVKVQLFANLVIGDKIVGLSTSQFSDQNFDRVKAFLIEAVSTLREANAKELDKLCGK